MVKTKGGYKSKNGFYVKGDCRNNEEDGHIDEEGYILDPLTYEKIGEGNLIQLSDDYCYNKSQGLINNINTRNTLPFGNAVTHNDKLILRGQVARPVDVPVADANPPVADARIPVPPARITIPGERIIYRPIPPAVPGQSRAPRSQYQEIYDEDTEEMDRYRIVYGPVPRSRYGGSRGGSKKRKSIKEKKTTKKRKTTKKK